MDKTLFSLIFGLVSTSILILVGQKLKVYGQKSFRRIKEESVPQLGGVGIVLSLGISAWYFKDQNLFNFLIVASPIIIGGIIDDFRELGARSKVMFQFISAGLLISLNYDNILWAQWSQHPIIVTVLSVFFIVTLCNAINFIDGLDGLVAAYTLSFIPIIYLVPNTLSGSVTIILGAMLAFTYFNKKPARIYLGDVGSNLIGLLMAYVMLNHQPASHGKHFVVLGFLMVFALPLVDLTLATVRRLIKGTSPFVADKDHIHHRLLKVGLNDTQVAIIFFAVGSLCSNVGWIVLNEAPAIQKWSILASSISVMLIILYLVFRTEGQLGKHISHFGRTLIETYINLSPVTQHQRQSDLNRAIILDLFNYYKELQRKGLPVVVSFIKDVSGFITFRFKGAQVVLLSSYSLGIIFPSGKDWTPKEKKDIMEDYFRLTDKHRATRIVNSEPEGLYFYNAEEFSVFYKEIQKKQESMEKQAA